MYDNRVRPTNDFIEFRTEEIEQSVPDRFEQQVRKYPDKLAVKSGSHQFTYDELNRIANRVAWAILDQRGEGEEPIALLFEHGISLIAAILGVLKAGKIYMTLDSSYPAMRLNYMLEHSQTGLIVTNNENLSFAEELAQSGHKLTNIDELDSSISDENPGLSISPDTLVSLYYTSGSTGEPKGVVENHRNRLFGVMEQTNSMNICVDDRLTFLASAGFSASIGDIFPAILNGATLLPFDLRSEGLGDLAAWMIREEITFYNSSPTVLRHFVNTLTGDEKFPELRLIRMNSEPLYKWDVDLYKKHFSPGCLFANGWGATELPYFRLYLMDKDTQIIGNNVPIGYADEIEGLMLLDDDGQPVDFDQPGEIVVKSRYLVPGYWRNPDLTRAKFLPDPDGGDERIYHTGDMALMRSDGSVVHLGRKDFQVKIRGSRVEVAEIEKALLDLSSVREAAVVAREDRSGEQRLVAYVVPERLPAPTITTLRHALAETLPDYMIPSSYVILDALPLTETGKIDRLALPDPGTARPELDVPFMAPRTPEEDTLAEIWSDVLELDEVGIHDNFLDLGGNSLMATQIISQVTKTFDRKLPLVALLHAPTIEQLADIVSQKEWTPPWSSLVAIQSGGSKIPIFCVHACDGEVLFYTDLARHLGQEQPFYALRAQGLDGKQDPHTRIEDMAAHYISEMQAIRPEGPYFLGGGGVGGMIAYEMAQQLLAQEQEVGLLALIDTGAPRPVSSTSNPYNSQKSLGHYVHRLFHYLRHGQLTLILKDKIRRRCEKIALMFNPSHIRRVRNAIDMAPWSYVPEVYPGRIIYFLSETRREPPGGEQATIGNWYELAAGGLNVFHVPGDHLDILKEPHVRILAEHLRDCLDEAQRDDSSTDRVKTISAKTDGLP